MKKILIIGAGLSGLSCASYLKKAGFNPYIFEKEGIPGGKATSENVKDFICDKGFQVLLNNYSEVKKIVKYKDLDMQYFNSGAYIFHCGKLLKLYNPLYHPKNFINSDYYKIFKIKDYYNIAKTIFVHKTYSLNTNQYIEKYFSKDASNLFLKPFFKGIFLDDELEIDFNLFRNLLVKFIFGKAGLPKNGMIELSKQIIKNMNLDNIKYNMEIKNVENNFAYFKNGEQEKFDKIVFSIPAKIINQIFNLNLNITYNSNTTCYFSSKKNIIGKSILLIPDSRYKLNSIQCLSNISPQYSRNNQSIYSASTNSTNASIEHLKNEFLKLTNLSKSDVELIKSYSLPYALHKKTYKINNTDNIYFCGDWQTEPSIDGALKSGRLIAEEIINRVS